MGCVRSQPVFQRLIAAASADPLDFARQRTLTHRSEQPSTHYAGHVIITRMPCNSSWHTQIAWKVQDGHCCKTGLWPAMGKRRLDICTMLVALLSDACLCRKVGGTAPITACTPWSWRFDIVLGPLSAYAGGPMISDPLNSLNPLLE